MPKIELENIEKRFADTVKSKEWKELEKIFKASKDVYIMGNGGLHPEHLCDDMSRLLTKAGVEKYVHSLNSAVMITSLANDYNYNNLYVKWLQTYQKRLNKNSIVIGLSCSSRSKNVLSGLEYASSKGAKTFLIGGAKADALPEKTKGIFTRANFFHVHEVLSMLLLYQLIASAGGVCPTINSEIQRKSISSTISRKEENDK